MSLFDQRALQPGVTRCEVLAWAGYDFANSGYTTVVVTAVFSAYFVGVVANGADWATFVWSLILAISNLAVMLTMPGIGARVDANGSRKQWLLGVTLVCVVCIAALYWVRAGDVALAVVMIIISNYCYSLGETFCAAYLPELARPEAIGRVSGWGWSFGYVGGMLTLGLSLAWVAWVKGQGGEVEDYVPGTMLIAAVIYILAAMPMFLVVKERARPRAQEASRMVQSPVDWRTSWLRIRAYGDFQRLLWVGFFYNAGVAVVIALTAVYADQVLGFEPADTMQLFFAVNVAAAIGAFLFGYLEDHIGHRMSLALTLVGWVVVVLVAVFIEGRPAFWCAATLAGVCMGSSQSAGRALVATMAPGHRLDEFFGLWAFATRLAAIVGPLTYGGISWATGNNHRHALLFTGIFFVVALALLGRVNLTRGVAQARADDEFEVSAADPFGG
ncbi:MFS transporter [Lautropia dentalis]|uniref:MFS transporter n=1 Tax=Lautropia dentalis TaxID=2490857 RepID=A0A426FRU5_9BURK|nr:MFS transporter [Lautropia dentalis]RRN45432.1 MFS transporter [Lautropia dentalis]